MPCGITFNSIRINGMETNAAVFIGKNSASGWDSNNKNQQAIGIIIGALNFFAGNFISIYDGDLYDTPIVDSDYGPSTAIQS